MNERFGKHIQPLKELINVEVDFTKHPLHGANGLLCGLGTAIEDRFQTGKDDAVVLLENTNDFIMLHITRILKK